MAGAPKGNGNARRGKTWREALEFALRNYEDKENEVKRGEALRKIGKTLIQQAIAGDMAAIKEIGDRIDGKAVQVIDATIEEVTSAEQLTDEQLANIAATSSARAAKAKRSKKESNKLH